MRCAIDMKHTSDFKDWMCYGLIVLFLSNSYVKVPTSKVTLFGVRKYLRLNEIISVDPDDQEACFSLYHKRTSN